MQLSESGRPGDRVNLTGRPKLELVVTVLNVNEGHNQELLQQCSLLQQYAQYISKVRQYAAAMPLNQAVEQAVSECIQTGILSEFLSRNRSEVISMSIFEYDKELEEKKIRKAEYEVGYSEGRAEGIEEGKAVGIAEGKAEGIIETGYDCGLSEEDILLRLQKKLNLSLQEARAYLDLYGKASL